MPTKQKNSTKQFTHYIAESQQGTFIGSLSTAHFYSFLMDGSKDSGNIENEPIVLMYSKVDMVSKRVQLCARYFSIQEPKRTNAGGLIHCLSNALEKLGITDVLDKQSVLGVTNKPLLIGGGTDGASVNISEQNGMMGKMKKELPWIYWAWCYAHRLELASKDVLSSNLFKDL